MLTNCDTHENFPPGIFKTMPPLAKLPGGMTLLAAPFRIGALARAAFKPFTKDPIPAELVASWMAAGTERPRRQARRQEGHGRDEQALHARGRREAARLGAADPAHLGAGRQALPDSSTRNGSPPRRRNARIVEIPDANTFVPLDQPQRLADEIAAFVESN